MSDNCVFCKILAGEIPGEIVYLNDHVAAFRDINPVAPVHLLIIPKKHIASLNDLVDEDTETMGALLMAAKTLAKSEGVAESGYRTFINTGPDANQVVFHIHMHVMGGHKMRHPLG
jgi:histidine triad (HIT) family protein